MLYHEFQLFWPNGFPEVFFKDIHYMFQCKNLPPPPIVAHPTPCDLNKLESKLSNYLRKLPNKFNLTGQIVFDILK